MRALLCKQLGNPLTKEAEKKPLKVVDDHPSPALPANGVRILVTAAGFNFADVLQVQGQYQERPKLPFIPGSEVSGRVMEVGRDVRTVKVGDMVCGVTNGGAFAEECVIRESSVWVLPAGVDVLAAAGLPVAFGTAHVALEERAQVKPGQTVLILGAAGGVGIAAVQIAKLLGAKVVAVVRGQHKAEVVRQLGADKVVDTSQAPQPPVASPSGRHTQAQPPPPLRALIKAAAPQGVDVVVDMVGGAPFAEALKTVRWGAQILLIGFASGSIPKIAANVALVKNLTFHGIFWGSYTLHRPRVLRQSLEQLVQWLAEGRIVVPISHKVPLDRAPDAFKAMMSREVVGKVLLLPGLPQARL
ncbi:hypothetical protein WJX72_010753 [[Myrmecia] bisecta]|uniref:Enoyl reductase (ER) domain-containing protein n=1 Tax=[Myrmecia] bisecta TaxID=41462 RepID=A0AAW1PKN6_9CHLO